MLLAAARKAAALMSRESLCVTGPFHALSCDAALATIYWVCLFP